MKTTPEQLKRLANEQHAEITRLREENARLREKVSRVRWYATAPLKLEAMTAERDSLREENARLREALKPFAKMADELDDEWENEGMHWIDCHQFEHVPTVGDLRAARAAILEGNKNE